MCPSPDIYDDIAVQFSFHRPPQSVHCEKLSLCRWKERGELLPCRKLTWAHQHSVSVPGRRTPGSRRSRPWDIVLLPNVSYISPPQPLSEGHDCWPDSIPVPEAHAPYSSCVMSLPDEQHCGLPSVLSTLAQASFPPITSSTSFRFISFRS